MDMAAIDPVSKSKYRSIKELMRRFGITEPASSAAPSPASKRSRTSNGGDTEERGRSMDRSVKPSPSKGRAESDHKLLSDDEDHAMDVDGTQEVAPLVAALVAVPASDCRRRGSGLAS